MDPARRWKGDAPFTAFQAADVVTDLVPVG
jgi:hypothetical protein